MKKTTVLLTAVALSACTSLEKQQSNERAQVEIIKVQREALARQKSDEAKAQIALYESLARVAEIDPDSADAAVIAMLIVGQGANEAGEAGPLVQLREQRNEAIELTKALAPTVGGVLTNVGIAAINANTQRDQIGATRDVQINQANQTASAIASVAELGAVAATSAGDAITVTDNGWYNSGSYADNDTTTSTTTSNTTSNTTTSTTTSTETNTTDSYNSTTGNDYSVTYGGETMTLGSLLAFLQSTGQAYSLTIGDDVYESEGDGGDPVEIDCNQPQFSPSACVVDG